MRLNRVLHGDQEENLRFQPFPRGNCALTGRAVRLDGMPVKEFVLQMTTKVDWKEYGPKYTRVHYWRTVVADPDGRFRLQNLPAGTFTLRISPVAPESKEWLAGPSREIQLQDGQTMNIDSQLAPKQGPE
jgi:hypothetical protein